MARCGTRVAYWADALASSVRQLNSLGRSPSTVSREMSRNGGCDRYRAALADENAWARTRRPKCCKLANSPRLRRAVAGKLRLDWSPEQMAGRLKRTHPEDECNQDVTRDVAPSRLILGLAENIKRGLTIATPVHQTTEDNATMRRPIPKTSTGYGQLPRYQRLQAFGRPGPGPTVSPG
jgi:hypothetical protein